MENDSNMSEGLEDHLLILLRINDYVVRAIIDTGAASSVINGNLVEQLNLTADVDHRYRGQLSGIGSAQILGKITNLNCQIYDGIELLESTPLLIQVSLTVNDSNGHDLLILGVDFLKHVDAIIKMRRKRITIFDKDFAFLERCEEFSVPRLYTDLIKMQFSMTFKKVPDQDLLRKILFNIHSNPSAEKYRSIKKQALNEQLIRSLQILGFRDVGSHIVLDFANPETVNFALQVVCN